MAIVPKESVFELYKLKPSTVIVWNLLCEVRDHREPDVYLETETAARAGVGRTAYFAAFAELENLAWIAPTRRFKRRQYWKLNKGFQSANTDFQDERESDFDFQSANTDSQPPDFQSANTDGSVAQSVNADSQKGENPRTRTKKSVNADSHIRNKPTKEPLNNDSNESFNAVTLFQNDPAIREAITAKQKTKPKVDPITFDEWNKIAEVWFFWIQTMHKNANSRLSAKRGRAILDRLRGICGFSVAEIQEAIVGCTKSAHHTGQKQGGDGTVYNDIELICRDDDNVERFRGYFEASEQLGNANTANTGTGERPGKYDAVTKRDYSDFRSIEFDRK